MISLALQVKEWRRNNMASISPVTIVVAVFFIVLEVEPGFKPASPPDYEPVWKPAKVRKEKMLFSVLLI